MISTSCCVLIDVRVIIHPDAQMSQSAQSPQGLINTSLIPVGKVCFFVRQDSSPGAGGYSLFHSRTIESVNVCWRLFSP